MNAIRPGCESHQRWRAAVHSTTRSSAPISWHPSIAMQYTLPNTSGETSPAATAAIVSSRRVSPSAARPE